jgi:tryptophanyl-tRNA synthetase
LWGTWADRFTNWEFPRYGFPHRTTHVPVGEDQLQHLELAREVANLFHRRYRSDVFPLPQAIMTRSPRVMSLKDARHKMSKSDPSDTSRINLTDTDDVIRDKIRKATSDSIPGVYAHPDRPEMTNLIGLYREAWLESEETPFETEEISLRHLSTTEFKNRLAEILIKQIAPIRDDYERFRRDPDYLRTILQAGQAKAFVLADQTSREIASILGIGL